MRGSQVIRQIPKWVRMARGTSVLTAPQGKGTQYALEEIRGYYNDLTGKLGGNTPIDTRGIPYSVLSTGQQVYSPVTILQYGLALYDQYLKEQREESVVAIKKIGDYILKSQDANGGWGIDLLKPERPYYSAMAQGEAISFLTRFSRLTGDDRCFAAIGQAYQLLIKPVETGGVAQYQENALHFYEYPEAPLVLNGSIFALWGLMDYYLFTEREESRILLDQAVRTLADSLPNYDMGFWSFYSLNHAIASPFYHALHIAQLQVLSEQFPISAFGEYAVKWEGYQAKRWNRICAVSKKVLQKVRSEQSFVIVK